MFKFISVVAISLSLTVPVLAKSRVQATKSAPTQAQKRAPSNTKACSEQGCPCDELNRQTHSCAQVLSPSAGTPRSAKSMRECFLNLVQKRREATASRPTCPVIDRSTAQIEDLRALLARSDTSTAVQVSSSKGLEGFGLDLSSHLSGTHRTPASGN